ncbi:Longitudinals lacking protein [Armadillidium nasatum]|uniref:Longitudinals lacking protein n=1 Tax=Armadillidium nasatum TaxID=96803 RepID=A0A5N5SP20_9CRUS|nr:Longitudinals lacking protein [Armadillidium nasatum]
MDSGLLSLKWNNHSSTFFHVLETIRKKELYSDVTIACDGKFFSVHKLVLSTCSEYFQEMFERTQCKHPIIVLKDISYKDLESLLNYMYIGEVNVIQTELSSLIKAAECLRVKGLAVPDEPPLSQKKSNKRPNTNDKEDGSSSKRNRRSGSFSQNQSSTSSSKDDRGNVDTSSLSSSEMPSHPTLGGSKETESRLDNQSTNSYKEFETVVIKTEKEDANTENYVENDLPPISKFEYEGSEPVENESNVNQRLDDGSESSFSSHQQQQQSAEDSMGHLMPSTSGFQGESSSWGSEMEGMEEGNKERGEGGSYDPNSTYLIDNSQGKAQVVSVDLDFCNECKFEI